MKNLILLFLIVGFIASCSKEKTIPEDSSKLVNDTNKIVNDTSSIVNYKYLLSNTWTFVAIKNLKTNITNLVPDTFNNKKMKMNFLDSTKIHLDLICNTGTIFCSLKKDSLITSGFLLTQVFCTSWEDSLIKSFSISNTFKCDSQNLEIFNDKDQVIKFFKSN